MIDRTKEEIAWIAGLLEGEGCFTNSGKSTSPIIYLMMCDLDVVEKAKTIIGSTGKISIRERGDNHKLAYRIYICGKLAYEWMKLIYPLMGKRRQAKIDEVTKKYDERFITGSNRKVCKKGHSIEDPKDYFVDERGVKQCHECNRARSLRDYHKRHSIEYVLARAKGITVEEAKKLLEKNPIQ